MFPSTVEGDGRGVDYDLLRGRPGNTNAAHNNPDSEIDLRQCHMRCRLGWLEEVLGLEDFSNKGSRVLRTVRESRFGPLNCQIMLGLIKREEIPELVFSNSRGHPNNMELAQHPNHRILDVLQERRNGFDLKKMFFGIHVVAS